MISAPKTHMLSRFTALIVSLNRMYYPLLSKCS